MKKVTIKADLLMETKNHQITITGYGKELMVNIIGKSAFYLPLRQLLNGYASRKKSTFLNHPVQVKMNDKNLLKVNQGKIKIDSYPGVIKIFIRSLLH